MKVVISGFVNTMSKPQQIAGLVYIPFHLIVFPLFIGMMAVYLPSGLTDIAQQTIYYGLGLAFCLICMWGYLRRAYDIMLDNMLVSILALSFALISYFLLTYLAEGILFAILGDQSSNPNNNAIMNVADKYPNAIFALTVFIAPLVEETLFRGVLFGSLRPKHRILAYALSIGLFALYHVWQYALNAGDWMMLIYMLEYIPAGYVFAWLYAKTNCIWLPIFLHMGINLLSMITIA
jgi:uncharacterized protein